MLIDLTENITYVDPLAYPQTLVLRVKLDDVESGVYATPGVGGFIDMREFIRQPVVNPLDGKTADFVLDTPSGREGNTYYAFNVVTCGSGSFDPYEANVTLCKHSEGWDVCVVGVDVFRLSGYSPGWVERNPDSIVEPARPRQLKQNMDQ